MQEKLKALEGEARGAIEEAASLEEVEGLRVRYLGRKGKLTLILRAMKDLPAAERPVVGKLANEIRARLEDLLQERRSALVESQKEERLEKERIDVTMPGARPRMGNKHPLTLVLEEIKEVFMGLGFRWWRGRRLRAIITTSKPSTCPPTIPPGICRILLYYRRNPAPTHTSPSRPGPWKGRHQRSRCGSSAPEGLPADATAPTPPCSTRWRAGGGQECYPGHLKGS